ncbi:MAG: hypothetical protein ABI369_12310 [Acetobacteraceae bacterium]
MPPLPPTRYPPDMADIQGTTVFTGERSQRGYRLNRLAMSLTDPAARDRFRADEADVMRAMGLSTAEIDLVARRDWAGMVAAGGSIYLMIKIAGTLGQNLLEVGAQMRGQTLDQLKAGLPGLKGH